MKFSAFQLLKQAITGEAWPEQWASPEPRAAYDVVIVGAGACGLTAALSLARQNIETLVLERDAQPQGSTALSSGFIPAFSTAAFIAVAPNFVADTDDKLPLKLPMGVRTADTI